MSLLRSARALGRRLARDRRGVAAIEFAMIAPVIMILVVGTMELSHMFTVQASLDGVVGEAARYAAARVDDSEDTRDAAMRDYITQSMTPFPMPPGGKVTIKTTVYRTFGSSYPEGFVDANGNGRYDGPSGSFPGETFDDRNHNGKRDIATPITGKMGGPGDVVSYTAEFPSALYFDFFTYITGADGFTLTATTVLRNEPVKSKDAGS